MATDQTGYFPVVALAEKRDLGAVAGGAKGVGDVQYWLAGAEIALEAYCRCARVREHEFAELARSRTTKPINCLRLVPHYRQASALEGEASDDVDLQPVDILVLVYKDVIEALWWPTCPAFLVEQCSPVKQQVVEVQDCGLALASRKGAEKVGYGA